MNIVLNHGLIGVLSVLISLGVVSYVRSSAQRYVRVIGITALLTWFLIMLGAYVRLSDAGLGCPDWPGCYGHFTPAQAVEKLQAQELINPTGPVSSSKAWKEMIHRYWAGIVGSLIFGLVLLAWKNRRIWFQSPWIATAIGGMVIFQAFLGAWTVTMLLKPAIVTGHLLGGVILLALMGVLWLQQAWKTPTIEMQTLRKIRWPLFVASLTVLIQVVLGGWVSTNYAALACTDFPLCQDQWLPAMDFQEGFHLIRDLGLGPDGKPLSLQNLTAIHWVHRLGAAIVLLIVGAVGGYLLKSSNVRGSGQAGRVINRSAGLAILFILGLQITLGITNVLAGLPLLIAVAHNGQAALLFAALAGLTYLAFRAQSAQRGLVSPKSNG